MTDREKHEKVVEIRHLGTDAAEANSRIDAWFANNEIIEKDNEFLTSGDMVTEDQAGEEGETLTRRRRAAVVISVLLLIPLVWGENASPNKVGILLSVIALLLAVGASTKVAKIKWVGLTCANTRQST